MTKNRFLTNLFADHQIHIKNRTTHNRRIYVKIIFRLNEIFRIIYACMRSVVRLIKIVLKYKYLIIMIDNVYINCDRCIATMIIMIITIIMFKKYEYDDFKRFEYDDLDESFRQIDDNDFLNNDVNPKI